MVRIASQTGDKPAQGFLARLARDQAGNTLALIAAAILPMLAMIGGGIDMGRSYLSQTRLQQACDAGVLAARKKLGSEVDLSLGLPADANDLGQRFFNINFQDGAYGTENISFAMDLEADNSVSGVATVDVPTTIMSVFGNSEVAIDVACSAQLNMNNTDIMFVLDTTGSMLEETSDGPTRIEALRTTVKSFYNQVEAAKSPGTRVRYGFVPYSTNVNVGGLLKSDWLVGSHTYQTRVVKTEDTATTLGVGESWHYFSTTYISGSQDPVAPTPEASCPADTLTTNSSGYTDVVGATPPERWYTIEYDLINYNCVASDGGFIVSGTSYSNYIDKITEKYLPNSDSTSTTRTYDYLPVVTDVSSIKAADGNDPTEIWATIEANTEQLASKTEFWYWGCIEERKTYDITDYSAVDLNEALDLNLDLVPDPGNDETKWKPSFAGYTFARGIDWGGNGSFLYDPELDTTANFVAPDWIDSEYECPSPAQKLSEISASPTGFEDLETYLDDLVAVGNTYHDIGMIWGGRLLSKDGLFAAENADETGKPTSRHLIFLTDGLTAPYDILYSSYGIEPLDKRRWDPETRPGELTQTVEDRFAFMCTQVKAKNITIWVISFGLPLTDAMTACASSDDHAITADDSAQLEEAFTKIAGSLADLRINK